MVTPELISYIDNERANNTPDTTIKSNLLANGWTEADIAEAMPSTLAWGTTQQAPASNIDQKEHEKKLMWNTFFILVGLDVLTILLLKLSYGTYGIFGLSLPTIVVRLLIIYLISSFSVKGAPHGTSATKLAMRSIARIISSVVMFILIATGIIFAFCLFGGLR